MNFFFFCDIVLWNWYQKSAPDQLHELDNRLSVIINKSDYEHKLTLQKKLNNLYKGHLQLSNNIAKYINLSDCYLTQ